MYRGQILDVLPAEQATREGLGLLMAGVERESIESDGVPA
jgi:hypothetical protein